jgi:dolichol-phosphate mannosyltransferase
VAAAKPYPEIIESVEKNMAKEIKSPRVLCIAPAWNEGSRIKKVVTDVPRDLVEKIVVIDDGSSDDTADLAQSAGATVIRFGRNQGVGSALRAGIDYALEHEYNIVVIVSGGNKTPPRYIPQLLEPILRGEADLAQGSRYKKGGQCLKMPVHRRLGTRGYTLLFSLFSGHWLSDASSGYRAFRTSLLEDKRINLWQDWLNRYELEPYLLFKSLKLGYRIVEVPVTIEYPKSSESLPYTKMRAFIDWWKIFRPVLFLFLKIKK